MEKVSLKLLGKKERSCDSDRRHASCTSICWADSSAELVHVTAQLCCRCEHSFNMAMDQLHTTVLAFTGLVALSIALL